MSLEGLTEIAYSVLVIGGAVGMIVLACASIYVMLMVRSMHGMMKSIKSGYESMQQWIHIPLMMIGKRFASEERRPPSPSSKDNHEIK